MSSISDTPAGSGPELERRGLRLGDISFKTVAVTGERRYRDLPDVPTLKELGIPMVVDQYFSVCAPAGVSGAIVKRLDDGIREALKSREVQEAFYAIGQTPTHLGSREVAALQLAQYRSWEKPVKVVGYVPE